VCETSTLVYFISDGHAKIARHGTTNSYTALIVNKSNVHLNLTNHCVQPLRSMPVSARVVRIAVLIKTRRSASGFGPSRDGDHGPPIAIGSLLPRRPTRNWIRRVGCWKDSRTSGGSSAREHDCLYSSSIELMESNITWNNIKKELGSERLSTLKHSCRHIFKTLIPNQFQDEKISIVTFSRESPTGNSIRD
jgi:hypothetical protein